MLAFVGYQLWGTGIVEARTQDRLRSDFLDALELRDVAAATPAAGSTPTSPPRPVPSGDAVALLRIPKIGVEKAVVEALKAGSGHYPTTPSPDSRETPPSPATGRRGGLARVREKKIVLPTHNEVLAPSSDNLLTLTTCNPRLSAAQRLIIVGELEDSPEPATPPMPTGEVPAAGAESQLASELDDATVSGDDAPSRTSLGSFPRMRESRAVDTREEPA